MSKHVLSAAIALFFSSSVITMAAEEISETEFDQRHSGPAVSGLNAKISIGYSDFDFTDITTGFQFGPVGLNTGEADGLFVEGSFTIPIGERFGFQMDAARADLDEGFDYSLSAIGAHLFWRDPGVGLLGVYGEYKDYGSLFSSYMIAAEGEIYRDQWSIEFYAGSENLETPTGDSDFFAGEALLAFYPTENFRLHTGVRRRIETTSLIVGAEAMMDSGPASPALFVDASFGEDDTTSVMGGVRLYWGGEAKSLIGRHREDDPVNRLMDGIDAVGSCINNAQSSQFAQVPRRSSVQNIERRRMPRPVVIPIVRNVFDNCSLSPAGILGATVVR